MEATSVHSIGEMAAALDDDEEEKEHVELEGTTIIPESLCMECEGTGTTKLMITKIPHFREVIVSSFECEDCGWRNTEVQFGGEIQERGVRYLATIRDDDDLDRQVIKSDTAIGRVPAVELEIPAATQQGVISTVEGILRRAAQDLAALQPARRELDPAQAEKIQIVVDRLERLASGAELPFSFELEDPSGNSFVEARRGATPADDDDLAVERYQRSAADNLAVGLHAGEVAPVDNQPASVAKNIEGIDRLDEAMTFDVVCPNCKSPGQERMCVTKIPHFKECVIMAFDCTICGYRHSEVKAGGAVPPRGQQVCLTVVDDTDLTRDLLKSDTAGLALPDFDLELQRGTLGSVYTTVEGMLRKIRTSLVDGNPFAAGDSADPAVRERFDDFVRRFDDAIEGHSFPFVLRIIDPLANSFIGPRRLPTDGANPLETFEEEQRSRPTDDPKDDRLLVEDYTRSWEEDEELGLHDIDTKGTYDLPVVDEEPEGPNLDMVDHPTPYAKGCDDDAPPLASTTSS